MYLIRTATIAVLALVIAAPRAGAAPIQYLSMSWNSSSFRSIDYNFNGSPQQAYLAAGSGYLDGVDDGLHSPGGTTLSRMYCCDLFGPAPQGVEWDVHEYTQADGLTGWLTPVGTGTDRFRDEGSLGRAAWLVNTFGNGALTPDQRVALNVVVWKAAYGNRFQYVSGLSNGAQTAAYNNYLVAYNQGLSSGRYTWFDSNYADTADPYQDFLTPTPPVPEPGTLMLLASGLLGSGFVVRRRRS